MSTLITGDNPYKQELRRSLRLIDLIVYGLVFMSPISGFTVFGFVREASHGAIVPAYAIGCLSMILTGFSYAAMSRAVPVAGSVYHYARRSMGETFGFIAGWSILLDYILLPALMILLGGVVMNSAIPWVPVPAWVIIFLAFATTVNILGLKATTRADITVAVVLVGVVIVFVIAALFALHAGKGSGAVTLTPVFPPGFTLKLAVSGASVAVLTFLGFDAISTLAEEVSGGDTRVVGRATIICLAVMGCDPDERQLAAGGPIHRRADCRCGAGGFQNHRDANSVARIAGDVGGRVGHRCRFCNSSAGGGRASAVRNGA